MTIRVAVADDQALVRAGLSGILSAAGDLEVIAEVATGAEAVLLARTQEPEVILMDVRMPEMDGIEATALITATTAARVLILSTFDLDEYVYAALRAGASGFLVKDTPPAELAAAVRVVAAGEAMLSPGITRRLLDEFAARSELPVGQSARDLGITEREQEVLLLVAEGLSNNEIGERLYVTAGTAKTHVAHLLAKLGARDRAQLAIFAYRSGLMGRG